MTLPTTPQVRLEPWLEEDWELLQRLNAPEMTAYLGGPESPEKLRSRQQNYVKFGYPAIVLPTGERVGAIGYWATEWQGRTIWETGWKVLPEFGGRGIATAAVAEIVARTTAERLHEELHAFPNVDNAPSNAICRKAGFALVGECDFEFPKGRWMRCNDWQLDLTW